MVDETPVMLMDMEGFGGLGAFSPSGTHEHCTEQLFWQKCTLCASSVCLCTHVFTLAMCVCIPFLVAPASATDSSYETLLFSLMSSVAHVMVYHASDVDRLHISYLEVNTLRARVCACVLECVCVRVCLSACVCECVCV